MIVFVVTDLDLLPQLVVSVEDEGSLLGVRVAHGVEGEDGVVCGMSLHRHHCAVEVLVLSALRLIAPEARRPNADIATFA